MADLDLVDYADHEGTLWQLVDVVMVQAMIMVQKLCCLDEKDIDLLVGDERMNVYW